MGRLLLKSSHAIIRTDFCNAKSICLHGIDLYRWICGPVVEVRGLTARTLHAIETEDVGMALLRFESGALGQIVGTMNSVRPVKEVIRQLVEEYLEASERLQRLTAAAAE